MYRCIWCHHSIPALYTQYTDEILKIELCENCGRIADKYVEYDLFIIIIDLIVFRVEAYRHIINNVRDYKWFNQLIITTTLNIFIAWMCDHHASVNPNTLLSNEEDDIFSHLLITCIGLLTLCLFLYLSLFLIGIRIPKHEFLKLLVIISWSKIFVILLIPWKPSFHSISTEPTLFHLIVSNLLPIIPSIQGVRALSNCSLFTSSLMFIFGLLFLVNFITARNNQVAITLKTSWSTSSLHAEVSEYLAKESPHLFWEFVDDLNFLVLAHSESHDEAVSESGFDGPTYHSLEHLAMKLMQDRTESDSPSLKHQLFRLTVSSRTYSPSVDAWHQVAIADAQQLLNCSSSISSCLPESSWALVGDVLVRTHDSILASIRQAIVSSTNIFPKEKIYPDNRLNASLPTVILYGDLRDPDFYHWHKSVKSLAQQGLCNYAFRHYFKDVKPTSTWINGYGVELVLKSTEYKAVDDSKVEDAVQSIETGIDSADENIAGFNFTKLVELHPKLESNLRSFQKDLIANDNELRPVKTWQLHDLGFKATQFIMDAFKSEPNGSPVASLERMRDVSQNLPARVSNLIKVKVDAKMKEEINDNQYILQNAGINPGDSLLALNGFQLSPSIDLYALLDLMRTDFHLVNRLTNIGLKTNHLTSILYAPSQSQSSLSNSPALYHMPGQDRSVSGRYSLDLTGLESPIIYLNNLELDSAYSGWQQSPRAFFSPMFYMTLIPLRLNLYNLVLVGDPANASMRSAIRLVESMLVDKRPIRFGLLLDTDASHLSPGLALARAYLLLTSTDKTKSQIGQSGQMTALSFLTDVYAKAERENLTDLTIDWLEPLLEAKFTRDVTQSTLLASPGTARYDSRLKSHTEYIHSTGLKTVAHFPLILFNGIIFNQVGLRKSGGFEELVMSLCMEEQVHIKMTIEHGYMALTDSVFDLYKSADAMIPRFNTLLLAPVSSSSPSSLDSGSRYLNVGSVKHDDIPESITNFDSVSTEQLLVYFSRQMRYFQKGDNEPIVRPITIWLVVGDLDLATDSNHHQSANIDFQLVRAAVTYLRSSRAPKGLRLGLVFNPSSSSSPSQQDSAGHWLSKFLHLLGTRSAASGQSSSSYINPIQARNLANRVLKGLDKHLQLNDSTSFTLDKLTALEDFDTNSLMTAFNETQLSSLLSLHSAVSRRSIGLQPGQRAVVVNGRILTPISSDNDFVGEDFHFATRLVQENGVSRIADAIKTSFDDSDDIHPDRISELVWQTYSILQPSSSVQSSSSSIASSLQSTEGILNEKRIPLPILSTRHSSLLLSPPNASTAFDLVAVVNPCSREAQRLSHLLVVLQRSIACNIRIYFNPAPSLSELPVKSFYRFVWEPELFAPDTDDPTIPQAYFSNLPGKSLLTLGMDTPHGWMVAAVDAVHDLDNLRLADTQGSVEAVYELEYLLLEGHCIEDGGSQPPRGLQFTLGPKSQPERYDTLVMANLGYFQLKSGPGAWHLNLRSGRSNDLYSITEHENTDNPTQTSHPLVIIDSFRSRIISVRVAKQANYDETLEIYDRLESPTDPSLIRKGMELWKSFCNYAEVLCPSWVVKLKKTVESRLNADQQSSKREPINIFSLASGHLYERFMRIMMLTVLNNTQSPVKFWFLKNYLSPTFKQFIPHMAAEYGFDYELVQYQWPRWLRAQTEKQRIIWGYKILFLDVLFPLNVTKIIFVDADQIVRADMQELVDLDLENAPYGYTPFCDSRPEMDGFRFWKGGYWAEHLGGRPYHISALYVVDLIRFRQLFAGDRLRGQYQGLSQDPNSLSNLDQDLPNNMINQVAIKSLPQDWLWCETWCSEESKARAKTIDMCNNPQTKEPKLTAAMRIAPEWVKYDREIKRLWAKVKEADGETVVGDRKQREPTPRKSPSRKAPEKRESRDEL